MNSFLAGIKSAKGRKFATFATCGGRGAHENPLNLVANDLMGGGGKVIASRGFWRGHRHRPEFRQSVDQFVKQALEAAGKA